MISGGIYIDSLQIGLEWRVGSSADVFTSSNAGAHTCTSVGPQHVWGASSVVMLLLQSTHWSY